MYKTYSTALLLITFLCGCVDHRPRQADSLNVTSTQPERLDFKGVETATQDTLKAVKDFHAENTSSANAVQNSISGIGANLGKLAEKVQGFGGDLAHLSATMENTLNVQTSARAELASSIEAKVSSAVQSSVAASASLNASAIADLMAKVDVMAQAQAGLSNRIESMQQTVSSGRDSIVSTVQFSQQMADTIAKSYDSMLQIVGVMCGVICVMLEASRRRAESRFREFSGKGGSQCDVGLLRRLFRSLW